MNYLVCSAVCGITVLLASLSFATLTFPFFVLSACSLQAFLVVFCKVEDVKHNQSWE